MGCGQPSDDGAFWRHVRCDSPAGGSRKSVDMSLGREALDPMRLFQPFAAEGYRAMCATDLLSGAVHYGCVSRRTTPSLIQARLIPVAPPRPVDLSERRRLWRRTPRSPCQFVFSQVSPRQLPPWPPLARAHDLVRKVRFPTLSAPQTPDARELSGRCALLTSLCQTCLSSVAGGLTIDESSGEKDGFCLPGARCRPASGYDWHFRTIWC